MAMNDEVMERLLKFNLTEEEQDVVVIESSDIKDSLQDCEVSLFGKVIADKKVNLQGVKSAMSVAWANPAGLKIKEISRNFFQFIFKNTDSMERVLFGSPWVYDRYLLNLKSWEPGINSESAIFNVSEMWVQVWNVPLHWMSKEVGRKIGHKLGGTLDIVIPENGRHMRLKVMVSINKKLQRLVRINLGFEIIWAEIRYENLPYVCYYCGILGHNEKNCIKREKDAKAGSLDEDQFGVWLRAEPQNMYTENQRRHGAVHSLSTNDSSRNNINKSLARKGSVGPVGEAPNTEEGKGSTDTNQNRDAGEDNGVEQVSSKVKAIEDMKETDHVVNSTPMDAILYGVGEGTSTQLMKAPIGTPMEDDNMQTQVDEYGFDYSRGGRGERELFDLSKIPNLGDFIDADTVVRVNALRKNKEDGSSKQSATQADIDGKLQVLIKPQSQMKQVCDPMENIVINHLTSPNIPVENASIESDLVTASNLPKVLPTKKVEKKHTNQWKRKARGKGVASCANNELLDFTDGTLVDVAIADDTIQVIGDKRKSKSDVDKSVETKKLKTAVDREASPKWLPPSI